MANARKRGGPGPVPAAPVGTPTVDTSKAEEKSSIAPWPVGDKSPAVIGSNLSLNVISSAMRTATYGYRQNWVDILSELIERDPHGQAVMAQRILSVAGGRCEITPALFDAGTAERKQAEDLAKMVEERFRNIKRMKRSLASLLWGLYTGVSCSEIMWDRDGNEWWPRELKFVHSRRISYPDGATWQPHIVDTGLSAGYGLDPSFNTANREYGLRIADFPGKFIVHTPQVRGEYPTREGLGRVLAFWFALKGLAVRGGAQSVERFAKPWAIAYFATQRDGIPRSATDDDIIKADAAIKALGMGALSGATLPDSIKVVLERLEGGMTHKEFIDIVNAEISKVVLGQTDTTEAGPNGSRSAVEVRKQGTQELSRYDAASLCEDITESLIRAIVDLNWPDQMRFCPTLTIHPAESPDPDAIMRRAKDAVSSGMPIDADKLGDIIGLPLTPNDTNEIRRMAPMSMLKPLDVQQLEKLEDGEDITPPAPTVVAAPPLNPNAKPMPVKPPAKPKA